MNQGDSASLREEIANLRQELRTDQEACRAIRKDLENTQRKLRQLVRGDQVTYWRDRHNVVWLQDSDRPKYVHALPELSHEELLSNLNKPVRVFPTWTTEQPMKYKFGDRVLWDAHPYSVALVVRVDASVDGGDRPYFVRNEKQFGRAHEEELSPWDGDNDS